MLESEAHLQQALALAHQGQFQVARTRFEKLLQAYPCSGELWHNLGLCYLNTRAYAQAEDCFQSALKWIKDPAQTHFELAQLLQMRGAWSEAIQHYRQAWTAQPDYWAACRQGCHLLLEGGDSETATEWLEIAVQHPHCPEDLWRLLCFYLLAYTTETDRIQRAFEGWEQRFMRPFYPENPYQTNPRQPERPLKVGYLSADFSLHSATNTYSALFEYANRQQFELHAFYTRPDQTSSTEWFRSQVSGWHAVHNYTPEALAAYIRQLEIDILVDLSGVTSDDLKVLALQPAPLQLTGLGFGMTTGLTCLQGRFSDRVLTPPTDPGWNSEPLIYLTQVFHWFPHALHQRTRITPPPSEHNKTLTLGCGNHPFKLNRQTLETWSEILAKSPNTRLHLKFSGLEQPAVKRFLQQRLERCGIPVDKVILSGHSSLWEHLHFYNSLDLALDPFPYNGGVSTCEALWMGVPVISLSGGTRAGAAILSALKLTQWLTDTPTEYVARALELLHDLPTRQFWRKELRPRLQTSILCDGESFTREVEQQYRSLWQTWCQESRI